MRNLIAIAALVGFLLAILFTAAKSDASCRTDACWGRVHKARAWNWCKRHEHCIWRKRFERQPAGWRNWAWSTARCESGLRFHIATGNDYYGGLQYTPQTAWAAGFKRLPHRTTKWEQLTRSIWFARRHGTQHWPICGR